MLLQLSIQNYAIIDRLNIHPDGHLNIVTGETGAGKSIILGALSLILGDRADSSVLINKEEKCVVEATFNVAKNTTFSKALRAAELDEETQCIIRREIGVSGKSRAFVNDTPVTLSVLNTLTALLVDLHQQFDNHAIEDDNFQLSVVDILSKNEALKNEYQKYFKQYQQTQQLLNEKKAAQAQWQKEADYKQFLFDELETIAFQPNEIEAAELQLKQLAGAENIITILEQTRSVLDEGEQPIANEVKRQAQQLQSISAIFPDAQALHDRLLSIYAEAKDIASELEYLASKINVNPEQMQVLEERMDMGIKLYKKHAVNSTNELLDIQQQLGNDLQATLNLSEEIAQLEADQETLHMAVQQTGKALSDTRQKIAPKIASQITTLLAAVGMPNAQFKIDIAPADKPNMTGIDKLNFLLDANKSGQFQTVQKAASGGEMSRIALCIKSLIARAVQLPTLIFDEVDTGISGEAARQVSILLKDLAQYHQIICITHQPQVAAKGSTHFYVYKEAGKAGKINTQIRALSADEKIISIAKMIGGEQPSDAAISNAKELVET